jgi:hypothetical protein
MGGQAVRVPATLAETIADCAAMIDAAAIVPPLPLAPPAEPLPSLLEQCRSLTERLPADPEPVRTVHHFACTGGTLIAKCLACMPNTQLLSEVEPLSRLKNKLYQTRFYPTDLIESVRASSRGSDTAVEADLFLAGLHVVYRDCQRKGLRLILRDHTHSRYCVGTDVSKTPDLRSLVGGAYPVRAIVTVRHPLDSFLSLQKMGWLHFEPPSLDEYCTRYLRFLDDYEGVPLFKYEDFVERPEAEMRAMCEALQLPFAEGFEDLFSVHRLSGDSGRVSDRITPRERRPTPEAVKEEAKHSASHADLCRLLHYPAA